MEKVLFVGSSLEDGNSLIPHISCHDCLSQHWWELVTDENWLPVFLSTIL